MRIRYRLILLLARKDCIVLNTITKGIRVPKNTDWLVRNVVLDETYSKEENCILVIKS